MKIGYNVIGREKFTVEDGMAENEFIGFDWGSCLYQQDEILKGIVLCAGEDKNSVFLLTCEGFAFHDMPDYSRGEYEIFHLPTFENYDGVIVDFNSIHNEEAVEYIKKSIQKAKIPCVCVEDAIEGGSRGACRYEKDFEEIMEHLILEHGYRRLHFLSGPELDEQGRIRRGIFKKTMEKHEIDMDADTIIYGDFNFGSGKNTAYEYAAGKRKLPQAVVCANDYMAIGLIEGLRENGIRCPEDVVVTGVDYTKLGQMMVPRLTTLDLGNYEMGVRAYQAVVDMVLGNKTDKDIIIRGKKVLGQSCGCMSVSDTKTICNEYVTLGVQMDQSLDLIKSLNIHFTDIKSMLEFERAATPLISRMGIDYFYYCQCGSREPYYQELEMYADGITEGKEKTSYADYGDTVWCPIAYEKGEWSSYSAFDRKNLLPPKSRHDEAVYYIVMPVHRKQECIGYVVMGDFNWSLSGRVLQHLVLEFDRAFGNIRQHDITRTMLANVNKKWQYDELTSIYNRSGFYHKVQSLMEDKANENKGVMVCFYDLDGLKKVNDSQGHKAGDAYICRMANALREAADDSCVVARFGGDEFICLAMRDSEEDGFNRCERMKKHVCQAVSVSVGSAFGYAKNSAELSVLIQKADQKMYEDKVQRKKGRD